MKREDDYLEEQFRKFPRHTLSEGDQKNIHDQLMKRRINIMSPKRSGRQKNKWFAGIASVAAILIAVVLGLGFFTDTFDQIAGKKDHDAQNMASSADHDRSDKSDSLGMIEKEVDETNDVNNNSNDSNNADNKGIAVKDEDGNEEDKVNNETDIGGLVDISNNIQEISNHIVLAIDQADMATLASYVHPVKGVLFSPYVNINPNSLTFTQNEVAGMLALPDTLNWGNYEGSGMPIELTSQAYFDEFLNMAPYIAMDGIYENELMNQGTMINNIAHVFPDSEVVEYYNDGTTQNDGMDWSSVLLVYEKDANGNFKLVAIVRDMWTI